MIIDSFLFYNEFDLLEGRLQYLYDTVDYFVIIESDVTHSGKPKPLYFASNISRYRKYLNKILYFVYSPDLQGEDKNLLPHWVDAVSKDNSIENAQRNYISQTLKLFSSNDYVIISDVDEIPNKNIVRHLAGFDREHIYKFGQTLFYYNFRQKFSDVWIRTIMTKQRNVVKFSPNILRHFPEDKTVVIHNAGYHLSYWSDANGIKDKIENFSHQEFNNQDNTNIDTIIQRVATGQDIYGRSNARLIPTEPADVDPEIYSIFSRYVKI